MPTKPGIIYTMEWRTVKDNGLENYTLVSISDTSVQIDGAADEQVIPMTPSGEPCRISTDRREDKYDPPIRSKKATLKFLNSDTVNYSTFSSGEDLRFYVTVAVEGVNVFVGWLQQGDIFEPFLPQLNQEVVLTAIDGLAYLKGEQLTDLNGDKLTGKYRIAELINFCLRKTGLPLNVYVINNLREQDNPDKWQTTAQFTSPNTIAVPVGYVPYYHVGSTINISGSASNNGNKVITGVTDLGFLGGLITVVSGITNEAGGPTITWQDVSNFGNIYQTLYLDVKTFEDKVTTTIDCYSALERILGHDCILTQYRGDWYIRRVKEYRVDLGNNRVLFSNSATITSTSNFPEQRAIGLKDVTGTPFPMAPDATSFFSKAETQRTLLRPQKSVKLDFDFMLPQEILCNYDFSRGTFIADLADETIDGLTYNVKSYDPECWTYNKNVPVVSNDSTAYIKKLFIGGYEEQRYLHMPLTAVSAFYHFDNDEKIPVHIKDKFNFSVDYRYSTDLGGGSGHFTLHTAWIRLYGDDGSFWNLHAVSGAGSSDPVAAWTASNSTWTINQKFIEHEEDKANVDFREWQHISIEAPPIPVDGELEILLINNDAPNNQTKDFFNISFDYIPLINGSYHKYQGQSNTTTQNGNYKNKIEDQVYITNSPKKLFKGALFKKNNLGKYILVDLFYEGQEYALANDGRNHLKSYGELQVRGFHNQCRNSDEMYQITAQGLNKFSNTDLIHAIFNRDLEPNSNVNTYQLCWLDQDLKRCEWSGTMIRNFSTVLGFATDDFEFKYEY